MYWKIATMKLDRGRRRAVRHSRRLAAGYSLLEILIVLAIIALIAALVGPRLFAQLDHAKVTTARVQVKSLETALQTMEIDIGRYPGEGEGLPMLIEADRRSAAGWNGPYLSSGLPNDPWGRPYVYDAPTDRNHPPRVHSLGADGKPGGDGDAADIYSDAPAAAPAAPQAGAPTTPSATTPGPTAPGSTAP
jgi:general secretion pathway protein G